LNNNFVWAICENKEEGDLLIGTSAGINRIKMETGEIQYIRHNPVDPGSLCNDRIHAIHRDTDGNLWVATFDGLSFLRKGHSKFIHFFHDPDDPSTISHNNVYCIYEDSKGTLWFGTYDGLNRFDKKTRTFYHFLNNSDDTSSISCNTVFCLFEDSSKSLWVGTYEGLNKMDGKTGTFKRYVHLPGNPSSLSNNAIFCLYEDSQNNLWIGTWGGGVNQYLREKELFIAYREKDGIANDVVYGILEDSNKDLWMSTNHGLSRLNPATGRFITYDVHDGLICNEFNFGAYYTSTDGTFYFGTVEGLTTFNPADIKPDPHAPQVVITEFRVFNDLVRVTDGSYLSKSIHETEEITLDQRISVFSFEFASLHYSTPERNQYAYMLEGFDKDFITCGTRRFASYTNLDPGEYIFRVTGSNKDGVWNTRGVSLKIRINPPLWKTWWAYSLYIATGVGIILVFMRYRIRRHRETYAQKLSEMKIEGLKKLNEQRTNFFINIAHEIKTPLTLIINYLNRYIENRGLSKELNIIKVNIEKMARDIINFFDSEKLVKGKLSYNNDLMSNFTQILKEKAALFEELAQKKNIRFSCNTDDTIFINADPLAVERIINNLLDNAVKFTYPGGSVTIYLETREKEAVLTVSDNGPGIPRKKIQNIFIPYYQVMQEKMKNEGMGVGLFIVKKIVESLKGTIRVESKSGQGSVFTVIIPICDNTAGFYNVKEKPIFSSLYLPPNSLKTNHSVGGNKCKSTVFIVEDNKDLLELLKESMCHKYRVITATSGTEALKKLKSYSEPDIIISDIMMDGMDGYYFYQELKKNKNLVDIPFIFLTAKAGDQEKLKGLAMGAVDYIYKPFIVQEVLFKVDSIIRNRVSQRRNDYEAMKKKMIATFTIKQGGEEGKNKFVKMCRLYNISPREKEVIEKLILGLENKEIAAVLNISINTVRNHISSIYEKCRVQNRVEFVNLIR
jgi:signal transduction histidine kinase/DNA-binding NarL/FixJ family response regulator